MSDNIYKRECPRCYREVEARNLPSSDGLSELPAYQVKLGPEHHRDCPHYREKTPS